MGSRGVSVSRAMPAGESEFTIRERTEESTEARDITIRDVARLREAMGQTGLEAGDPDATPRNKVYVNSSKSFNINAYLLSDGRTIHSDSSDWDKLGYTKLDVERAIRQIDSGMKGMSETIKAYRYVDGDALGKMLGNDRINSVTISRLINEVSSNPESLRNLSTALLETDYTHKAYTSTTYVDRHGSYDTRPVKLETIIRQGTNAIVTTNDREHEILVGRGQKYNFTGGVRVDTDRFGNKQLVIQVIL